MEREITGKSNPQQMLRKASFIARLGSGSASRSIYPAMSLWGITDQWNESSNEYAIPVTGFHNVFRQMRDTILIVESAEKKVSSSAGHRLMDVNPFSEVRFRQARENLSTLHYALSKGDWKDFIRLMEEEALSLHAMMMTSRPGYLLMQPATLSIIQQVRAFRNETGNRVGFTLDAGANVHLLYAKDDAEAVDRFIRSDLTPYCEDGKLIADRMGNGPEIHSS
jgi:diphosphomevalonate decarboxylase